MYQMSNMKFAIFSVICVLVTESSGRNSFEGCTRQNTYDYSYVKMYPVYSLKSQNEFPETIFRLEFYIKAASNAHILLAQDIHGHFLPNYEIVLGAGQNLYSQIRLNSRGNKASQSTPHIMSAIEFRGFWIEVKFGRLIRVGKIGSMEPFLFWVGKDQGFSVRYFGFGTWNNVKGEWYFNCEDKSNVSPDSTEGEANMTDTQRLKNDLLTFVDPSIIPQREGYPEETIELHLNANYLLVDEKRGELTLSGTALVKWKDWNLIWEPDQYAGLKDIYVTPFQIWTPNLHVLNTLTILEKRDLLFLSGNIFVKNNGDVFWRVPFHSVTLCKFNYENWPFDIHNCTLIIGFWTEPLKIYVKNLTLMRSSTSEWEIQEIDGEDNFIAHIDKLGALVDISFRRRDPAYQFLLLPPFLGAAIMLLTSFWCQPDGSVKLVLNCGSVIILIAVLLSIGERISNTVTATPKIVLLYSLSLFIMCFPMFLDIALKYVPPYIHTPRWLSSILNSSALKLIFLLPENPETESNYSNIREREDKFVTGIHLVTIIERILFIIYFAFVIVPFIAFLTQFEMFNFE